VNKVVLTYISALVKFLYKTNSTFCNLVPPKPQLQNMLHMLKHTHKIQTTHNKCNIFWEALNV